MDRMPDASPLFTPLTVGPLTIRNRIVMAPMTRASSPNGIPGEDVARYYERRAAHGVGLIITEGTVIDHPAASNNTSVPQFHGDDPLAGWRRVADRVHAHGAAIVPQLWHVGADRYGNTVPRPDLPPVSPSGLLNPQTRVGKPMTEREAEEIVASFARAAADARRLGFDGIELHAAHGYLIDQFLWSGTNQRTDRYGGSPARRTRFACEVIAACRAATSPDFPIVVRVSQWKITDFSARLAETPGELAEILLPLADAGATVLHCSTRRFWIPEFPGSALSLAGWAKKISGLPVITVGSVGLDGSEFQTALLEGKGAQTASLAPLLDRFNRGDFDLVALGRVLLSDPAWAEKIQQGRPGDVNPFEVKSLLELG